MKSDCQKAYFVVEFLIICIYARTACARIYVLIGRKPKINSYRFGMNKKKFTVLALLMIVVLTLSSCLLFACNPDSSSDGDDDAKIEATEGLLINNGDFKVVDTSVKTYPRAVTGWTGAKMYSNSSFRDDVTAGVISMNKNSYNANKSKWKDDNDEIWQKLNANGRYDGDADKIKNALMIYMPKEGKDADGNKINGPTAYGYTSTSFTLDKGAYYKLTVDVLTHDIGGENEEERGARIYLSSNTYAEFSGIDTKGEWKTYEIYIETSPASTTSLTVMLGLGKYNSYFTKGLTSGYAFFDNINLEKIEDDDNTPEADGEKQFNAAKDKERDGNEFVATTTLKVPNGRFDFGSTTLSSSNAPSSWSLVTGNSGKDDPAPTSLGYNAVIDLSQFDSRYADFSPTYNTRTGDNTSNIEYKPATSLEAIAQDIQKINGRIGANAFMLSQQLMTAQGIRSSRTITIEKNKTYAISVQLYTYGVHGAGVSLVLTGSDGKDIKIKGISSNPSTDYLIGSTRITPSTGYNNGTVDGASTNGWRTYTFYIQGNQFRDFNYNMAIWLGTDGTSDNIAETYHSFTSSSKSTTYRADGTFSNGWVFIDDLELKELASLPTADDQIKTSDNQTLDCTVQDGDNFRGLIVDLSTENLFGSDASYILSDENASNKPSLEGAGVQTGATLGAPKGWTSNFDITDNTKPIITDTITEGIVHLVNEDLFNGIEGTYPGLPYDLKNKNAYMIHASRESYYEVETQTFTIKANQFYRLSLWVKTVDVSSSSGAYVYLLDKSKDDDKENSLTSFTKINTKDTDEYLNDWCELTIVLRGANDKDTDVALKLTLGTGDRWASSTLTSGAMFVANMNMSAITYANFKDTTTGTYVKSVDMSESFTYTFTNGSFDDYDLDDEDFEAGVAFNEQSKPGKPDDWTVNDKTIDMNTDDTSLFGGVIALTPTEDKLDFKSSKQATTVTGIDASVFNNFYNNDNSLSEEYLNSLAGPNMLAIGSKKEGDKYAIGYSSASITLSANTYYQLSVYAKTVGNTTASVFLTGESSASTGTNYFLIESDAQNGEWTKYTYYIEVGNTSVSVKLNLWLGLDGKQSDVDAYLSQMVDQNLDKEEQDKQKAELAKSSGAVFFDNIVYKTIDEDTYNTATDDSKNKDVRKKISFLTDSFDSLSSSIESRGTLTAPNGWTGAAESGLSSSNSKVGIAYADSSYYDTELVNEVLYSRLLGLDYKEEDIKVTDEELEEAKKSGEYEGKTDEEIVAALKAKNLIKEKTDNWIPVSELVAHSGNRMLVINNTVNSAYRYTSSSNTLKANSFYEISVFVRTYGLTGRDGDDTIGAGVELYLGSANESDKPLIFKGIQTQKKDENGKVVGNEWVQYKFYVQTRDIDVTSVTVRLSLGSSTTEDINGESITSGLTKGYALFDDVSIQKVDEDVYQNATEGDTVQKRYVTADTEGNSDENKDDNNKTPNKFNLEYLWWMIPTIIIGLVIIVVVIIFVIRKLRKKGVKKALKQESAPVNTEMLDKKRNRYDEGKE